MNAEPGMRQSSRTGTNFFQSTKYRIYELLSGRTTMKTVSSLPRPLESERPPTNDGQAEILRFPVVTTPSTAHEEEEVAQHALLPSALRLPFEILQEIFYAGTDQDDFLVDYPYFCIRWLGRKDLPWHISQVCRKWRYVALSSSFLWTRLPNINLRLKFTREKAYVDGLAEILRRSHDALVSLHISGVAFTDPTHPVADLLVRHSKRWGNITLDIPLQGLRAFQGAKNNIPALHTLRADWTEVTKLGESDHNSVGTFDLFREAPQLRNVRIMEGRAGELLLPYTGLLRYQQWFGRVGELSRVMRFSPGLTDLDLTRIEFGTDILHQDFHFPHLVFLRIHAVHRNLLHWLLNCITAPALEELQVNAIPDEIPPSVISMLSRLAPPSPLRTLHLRGSTFNHPGQLTDLLMLTPLLTHTKITMPPSSDIMALASMEETQGVLVPLLEDCIFEVMRGTSQNQIYLVNSITNARSNLRLEII